MKLAKTLTAMPLVLKGESFEEVSHNTLRGKNEIDEDMIEMDITSNLSFSIISSYLSKSSHTVHILGLRERFFREMLNQLPDNIKNYVKWIEDKGIYKKVGAFVEPLFEVGVYSPALDNFIYGVYKFAVANKIEAEVDLKLLSLSINQLRHRYRRYDENERDLRSALVVLSQIEGLLNLYEKTSIETYSVNDIINLLPISIRLNDILDDALLTKIKRERYFLGIPAKVKSSLILLRKRYREMATKRKFGKMLEHIWVMPNETVRLGLIGDILSPQKYSAPLIEFEKVLFECASNIAVKRKREIFCVMAPTNISSGWEFYHFNKNGQIFRDIYVGRDIPGDYYV